MNSKTKKAATSKIGNTSDTKFHPLTGMGRGTDRLDLISGDIQRLRNKVYDKATEMVNAQGEIADNRTSHIRMMDLEVKIDDAFGELRQKINEIKALMSQLEDGCSDDGDQGDDDISVW